MKEFNHNIVLEKHSLKFPHLGELTCIAFAYKPFLKLSKPLPTNNSAYSCSCLALFVQSFFGPRDHLHTCPLLLQENMAF